MNEQEMKLTTPGSANRYFMSLAQLASTRSIHPRFKHGAVIIDNNHGASSPILAETIPFPISIGYNRPPRRWWDLETYWELGKEYNGWTIHAEEDALLRGGRSTYNGCSIYVTGIPCPRCLIRLLDSGIIKVIYGTEVYGDYNKDLAIIKQMIKGVGGINLYHLNEEDCLVELESDQPI